MRRWAAMPVAGLVTALMAATLLAGCGSGAKPYPPTGIDELVIPTPSPQAADFVDRIDNAWLPLSPGRVWTYDVRRIGHRDAVRTVRVLRQPVEVDGVSATAVTSTTVRPGERPDAWTDYYAQDTRGDVWWLGRAGLWQAGRESARAGLVIAAAPRLGDGYRAAYEKGVVEDVVTVAGIVRDTSPPSVTLEWASALTPGAEQWDTFRKGIGMVDRLDTGTGEHEVLRTAG